MAILKVGVYWLIIGLVLHLICRGIWIGMVGLSYAFPKGINTEKLKYQEKYLNKVKSLPAFQEIILKLERVSSFIYSVSFLLFMALVGAYLYLFVLVVIPLVVIVINVDATGPIDALAQGLEIYSYIVLIVGFISLLDFVTLGYFRRFKWLARIFSVLATGTESQT